MTSFVPYQKQAQKQAQKQDKQQGLRLALFDFDGTLCDSAEQIASAIKKAGRDVGLMDINDEQARQSIGQGLYHLALSITHNDSDKANEFFDAYRHNFRTEMNSGNIYISPLFDGVKKCLTSLVAAGWLTGIVTNKGRNGLNHLLVAHEIDELFDVTYTVDEKQPKPSPEMAVDAMKACGVEIKNTVLIGDTIYDAQCAANAGISFVGVSWGYNSSDILSQNGARIIVNDFAQLQTSLDDIIPQIG